MKKYTVLTINPGSTSTKVGVVRGDKVLYDERWTKTEASLRTKRLLRINIRNVLKNPGSVRFRRINEDELTASEEAAVSMPAGGTYKLMIGI